MAALRSAVADSKWRAPMLLSESPLNSWREMMEAVGCGQEATTIVVWPFGTGINTSAFTYGQIISHTR